MPVSHGIGSFNGTSPVARRRPARDAAELPYVDETKGRGPDAEMQRSPKDASKVISTVGRAGKACMVCPEEHRSTWVGAPDHNRDEDHEAAWEIPITLSDRLASRDRGFLCPPVSLSCPTRCSAEDARWTEGVGPWSI